ncbi:hypothetical protein I4U23_021873 [Adineta vaga]|nr:hypothetical protein I4U23_021873 [Adineta vaga]
MKIYRYFLLFLLIQIGNSDFHYLKHRRDTNGCGPRFLNIDPLLKITGLDEIIKCCNGHDNCYGTCGKSKDTCDDEFGKNLNQTCEQYGGWLKLDDQSKKVTCSVGGKILYTIVNNLGQPFYEKAQKKNNC